MRRTIFIALTCSSWLISAASFAQAQTQTYPPEEVAPAVDAGSGTSTAFTGGDVTLPAVLAVCLFAAAIVALAVARRRAKDLDLLA